jgi:hypothetical protein
MKIDKITGRRRLRRPRPDLQRHARKCHICHHPQRAEIEDDFLNWHGPNEIVKDYSLPHWSVIYRHASALGLRARRNENIRTVLDIFLEQAESAPITANAILRAIRAYSCLKDDGTWVELPKRVIYQSDRKAATVSRCISQTAAPRLPRRISSGAAARQPRRISNRKSGIRNHRNLLKTNTRGQV